MRRLLFGQRGAAESKAPIIITLIVIGILVFLAYKFVPIKWRNMKFTDELQDLLNINYSRDYKEAARGAFNEYTMREKILNLAKQHQIPIKDPDRQMAVEWPERRIFTVTIDYEEVIDLPLYGPYVWPFHIYAEQDPHSGKGV
ncbi:hypothetical protein JXA80_05835 [bacterium]|nr:hypothetical protein [candidate division CSSED10-310 bacterium]